ncbi:MAG: NTP transferase domain-containing protein, partial [Nannocystaceae bacterium]|nr:NTP transferase domain-containing protein [Nannocystaceae bacterium]
MILAAGASTRMGRPKALIQWQGRPFFMHCVRRAEAAGCEPVVVVWGSVVLPEPEGVTQAENPEWELGPLSSLQVGLRAVLPSDPSGVLVMTVDRPHVELSTVRALVDAHKNTPNVVVQPRVNEVSGHPIVHPRSVVDELLLLAPSDSVRTVVGRPDIRDARERISVD